MKIAALISGGKDSIFSIMHCKCLGHEIVALGNLYPKESEEIDSWMYQSIGSELVPLLAECIGLPLIRKPILGKSLVVG
jgi:diphthine-ammonia ligase